MLRIKNKKITIIIIVIVAIALACGGYLYTNRKDPGTRTTQQQTQTDQGKIDLSPPTKEDAQRVDENKERIVKEQDQQSTPTTGSKTVTPTITYSGQYGDQVEVGAYVNGVLENNGTCEATFKNGSSSIKKQVTAVRGASSMDCPVMAVSASQLNPKGQWTVTVSYSSATASGVSQPRQIEIK